MCCHPNDSEDHCKVATLTPTKSVSLYLYFYIYVKWWPHISAVKGMTHNEILKHYMLIYMSPDPQHSQVTVYQSGLNLWWCGCQPQMVSSTASSTSGSTEASAGNSTSSCRGWLWPSAPNWPKSLGATLLQGHNLCQEFWIIITVSMSGPPVCPPHVPYWVWLRTSSLEVHHWHVGGHAHETVFFCFVWLGWLTEAMSLAYS